MVLAVIRVGGSLTNSGIVNAPVMNRPVNRRNA